MTSISASYPALPPPVGARASASATPAESASGSAPAATTDPASPVTPTAKSTDRGTDRATDKTAAANKTGSSAPSTGELDPAALAKLRELQAIDRKVHAHEAAHAAVAGNLGGAKSFSYVTGPDGVRYAVGGEVGISFGDSSNPAVTVENASRVRDAALAPADPSPQDLRVAARAEQLILQAQQDLSRQRAQAIGAQEGTSSSDKSSAQTDHPNIKAFRNVADAATVRTPQLDVQA